MNSLNSSRTFRLFAAPSFLEGFNRNIDWAETLDIYNENETEDEADYFALKSDWFAVGDDIRTAILKYASTESITKSK